MEGLSGAASIITVVQVASQLATQISKTREFWQSVQEAPQDISDIILDLDLLSSVLASIARSEQQLGGPPDPVTVRALERCTEQVKSLRDVVDKFELGFRSDSQIKRKWSACTVVRKKEKLLKLRESLMDAKTTLALAQIDRQRQTTGLFSTSSAQVQIRKAEPQPDINTVCSGLHDLQVQVSTTSTAIQSIAEDIRKALEDKTRLTASEPPNPVLRACLLSSTNNALPQLTHGVLESLKLPEKMRVHSSTSHSRNMFGTIYWTTATEKRFIYVDEARTEEYETISSVTFHPAAWLLKFALGFGIEIAARHSSRGWQHSISSIRAVPDDSLIFRFCESGNLEAVRELFIAGKASVQDVDSKGSTPLHYATSAMHVELSKFLVLNGADRRALDYDPTYISWTPACAIDLSHENSEAMLRLFEGYIDFYEAEKEKVVDPACIPTYLGDISANLGPGEPLNGPPRTHRQNGLSEVCSLCRYCRETDRCDLASNPQCDEYDEVSEDDEVSKEDEVSEDDEVFEDDEASDNDEMLSADLPHYRAKALSNFRAQHGRWKNRYSPGEYYCYGCLAAREGWIEAESDEESAFEMGEEVTYSMPGTFVE